MRSGMLGSVIAPWFAIIGSLASAVCQTEPGTQVETLRLEIVGASVSAGFVDGVLTGGDSGNETVPLQTVVKGWFGELDAQVQSRADAMMFLDAERSGTRQLERAARQKPAVVLAVDFLFWFAYGNVEAGPDAQAAARMERLKKGLALLDALPCPILVSDLPDMTGASPRMLRPSMIPAPGDLEAMNAAIRAWAAERPRVRVFDLAATVQSLKETGVSLRVGDHEVPTGPGALMQKDLLHANRLGVAYLVHRLQPLVREMLPELARKGLPERTLPEFCEYAGATVALEDLEAEAKKPKKDDPDAKRLPNDSGK